MNKKGIQKKKSWVQLGGFIVSIMMVLGIGDH